MLNDEQKKAIFQVKKPLIVISGPGCGKTTLITYKIKHLIEKVKLKPENILAITFTKKASLEMSKRVEDLIEEEFFSKTFHEFALEIIENYFGHVNLIDKNFTLIDKANQHLFFLENLLSFNLSYVNVQNNHYKLSYEIMRCVCELKEFGYDLKKFEKIKDIDLNLKTDILLAFSKYELYKKEKNLLDYSDLLLCLKDLFLKNPKILEKVQNKYKYILVDEFQDTNKVQLDILKLIAKNNITIVGDKKQSIYSFRGANILNFDDFMKFFKDYELVYLKRNYRSSKEIIDCVNKVILNLSDEKEIILCEKKQVLEDKNKNENQKQNENQNKFDQVNFDENIKLYKTENEFFQKNLILENIKKILKIKENAKIGILFRRHSELVEISNFLKENNVFHNVNSNFNFFEKEIIKEVLVVLKIINEPKQAKSEFFYFLKKNYDFEDIFIQKIFRSAKISKKSVFKFLEDLEEDFCDFKEDFLVLKKIYDKFLKFVNLAKSKINLFEFVKQILFDFKFYNICFLNNDLEKVDCLNFFLEFSKNFVKVYKSSLLDDFLKICELSNKANLEFDFENFSSNFKKLANVELLTIHQAKGCEFDFVFMPYLNQRRFPSNFRRNIYCVFEQNKQDFLDEEKRLFFVGISRARKSLILSYVKKFENNKLDSKKSEFLDILDLKEENFNFSLNYEKSILSKKDFVKNQIINKIKLNLLDDDFFSAKENIDLLVLLFGKKTNLNFFLNNKSSNLKYEFYKKKIQSDNFNQIDFDSKKQVYSVSQLKTYQNCPKKYLFSYIYCIPSDFKHYFDFGTSIHSVLEIIAKDVGVLDDEKVFAKACFLLKKNWISKGYLNSNQEEEYFQKAQIALREFILKQKEIIFKKKEIFEVEKKFFIEYKGKKLIGFIDRIDKKNENFEILDYKTSNSVLSEQDLKTDLQLYVYLKAVEQLYGKKPKTVGLWYLIFNKIVKIKSSLIDSKKIEDEMDLIFEKIDKKDFKPTPSFFACNFCDYKLICKDCICKK